MAVDPDDIEARLAEHWGRLVAQHRERSGLSQRALAELAGVSQQTVSKIEHGRMIPIDRVKASLARALKVPPGELFAWPAWTSHSRRRKGRA